MKNALFSFALTIIVACSPSKAGVNREAPTLPYEKGKMVRKNEKCYQNCLIPDKHKIEKITYPIYKGKDPLAPLATVELMKKPGGTKWVKKDMVYCLEEMPPVIEKIVFLKDTINFRDFQYQTYEKRTLMEAGGFRREIEIVCPEQQDGNLAMKIGLSLRDRGYLNAVSAAFDANLETAMEKYARDYGLPVGAISVELIQHLDLGKN
jgi:hypothetical protein